MKDLAGLKENELYKQVAESGNVFRETAKILGKVI